MKKLLILCAMFAIACNAPKTDENKGLGEKDTTSNAVKTGADQDEHGCIGSAGYTWSVLKNDCIRAFDEIKLMPVDNHGTYRSAAFLLFNADQSQAELFMPDKKESLILDRTSPDKNIWKNDDFEVTDNGGYVIKQGGNIIYNDK
ncbi:hypothetical protein [Pedobacter endophyticus]|uniref:Lipoprotein n=1 Tax=Pedobacter endophyticus TaxID=2789740 RepID=A0A7U3Q3P3_9SPHI|nr:hypothetical protein [Pedobacter endophyticus]QPH38010.1 hypothetical protein IZT61_12960 [Pedobacter endophyticus]